MVSPYWDWAHSGGRVTSISEQPSLRRRGFRGIWTDAEDRPVAFPLDVLVAAFELAVEVRLERHGVEEQLLAPDAPVRPGGPQERVALLLAAPRHEPADRAVIASSRDDRTDADARVSTSTSMSFQPGPAVSTLSTTALGADSRAGAARAMARCGASNGAASPRLRSRAGSGTNVLPELFLR